MSRYTYDLPDHEIQYGVELPTDMDLVHVDPQAQRTLNERRAQGIADNLQLTAIGTITASRRGDGSLWLVDGQHRRRALQLKGISKMHAEVHEGLDVRQEAILFLIKNRESSRPGALDEYKIGLTGCVQQFVDTEEVFVRHSLKPGRGTSANQVGAVSAAVKITERYGSEALDFALTVAETAWGRTDSTWEGNLLGGLAMFYDKFPDLRGRGQELGEKLGKTNPAYRWVADMHARASGGNMHGTGSGGRASAACQLFIAAWNKGRSPRHRVPPTAAAESD
jgi:hypothetical protein